MTVAFQELVGGRQLGLESWEEPPEGNDVPGRIRDSGNFLFHVMMGAAMGDESRRMASQG